MAKKYQDIYVSAFLIALSVAMYIATFNIKVLTVAKIGAAFMPRVVAIAIFILSIVLLISSVKGLKASSETIEDDSDSVTTKDDENVKEKTSVLSVLGTVGLMIVYVFLLPMIGFIITTAVYLFLQMYLLADKAYRKISLFIIISVVSSVVIYYVFKTIFYLRLPAGILG